MNIKKKCALGFLIVSSVFIQADRGRELTENSDKNNGHIVLGGITSAGGMFMVAEGIKKTILGNTGCNYPSSFIARSFRGTKTRCAGIVLALAGLTTYDLGATLLTQPTEGIKLYHNLTEKVFQPVHYLFSLLAEQPKDSQNKN